MSPARESNSLAAGSNIKSLKPGIIELKSRFYIVVI